MDLRSNKKSLSNLVYRDLKEKILKNKLLPGDKLIEMENAIQQSDIKNEIKLEKIDNVNIDVEGLPCKVCGHIIEIKENCTSCPKCHTINCG